MGVSIHIGQRVRARHVRTEYTFRLDDGTESETLTLPDGRVISAAGGVETLNFLTLTITRVRPLPGQSGDSDVVELVAVDEDGNRWRRTHYPPDPETTWYNDAGEAADETTPPPYS